MDKNTDRFTRRFKYFFNVAKTPLKVGAAVVLGVVLYNKIGDDSFSLKASWTNSYEPDSSAKWDSNWDR